MKDMVGTVVEVGDIIVAAASSSYGHKLGKVYGFRKDGSPMVKHVETDWRTGKAKWRKSEAGINLLVLQKGTAQIIPIRLFDELRRDYDLEEPK